MLAPDMERPSRDGLYLMAGPRRGFVEKLFAEDRRALQGYFYPLIRARRRAKPGTAEKNAWVGCEGSLIVYFRGIYLYRGCPEGTQLLAQSFVVLFQLLISLLEMLQLQSV